MATEEIVIETRIGKRAVSLDKVLSFPRGLIGYENQRRFTLLTIKEDSPVLILQSLDDSRLGLLVADPYTFLPEYEVPVGPPEQKILQVTDPKSTAVLVTVSIPPGHPEKPALNLTGPIIITYESKIGLQIPQVDADSPSHFFLHGAQDKGK